MPQVMRFVTGLVAIWLALCLCSCTEERTEAKTTTDAKLDRNESIAVSGTISIPTAAGVVPIPVDLHVERTVTETKAQVANSQANTTKTIDSAAIAKQLGGVLGQTINVALAKMTGGVLGGQSSSAGWLSTPEGQILGGSGMGGALAFAIQQMLVARQHRKDSDEAWNEIKEKARSASTAPDTQGTKS